MSASCDKPDRGRGTVSFPEMRRGAGSVAVRRDADRAVVHAYNPMTGWHSQAQAWAMTQGQLAWYRAMEERGRWCRFGTGAGLEGK